MYIFKSVCFLITTGASLYFFYLPSGGQVASFCCLVLHLASRFNLGLEHHPQPGFCSHSKQFVVFEHSSVRSICDAVFTPARKLVLPSSYNTGFKCFLHHSSLLVKTHLNKRRQYLVHFHLVMSFSNAPSGCSIVSLHL